MKNLFMLMMVLAGLAACGKQEASKLYQIEKESLSQYINQKSMPADPNLTVDKSIVNNSYPIQIALYKDGRFFYELPTFEGGGQGTWKNTNGVLELKAKTRLFDMNIEIHGADTDAETLAIKFTDRFGPNTLKMTNINI